MVTMLAIKLSNLKAPQNLSCATSIKIWIFSVTIVNVGHIRDKYAGNNRLSSSF